MDEYERDLIENPPEKCPYFTVPDVCHFLTAEDIAQGDNNKKSYNSLIELFGTIERMSEEQSTQFLLHLLKNSGFKPDFSATADALNVSSGHQVKRRFEAVLKNNGFNLGKDDQIKEGALPKGSKPARRTSEAAKPRKKAVRDQGDVGSPSVNKKNDEGSKKRRAATLDEGSESDQGEKRHEPKQYDGPEDDYEIFYRSDDFDIDEEIANWIA